jgi:hypothetical protein
VDHRASLPPTKIGRLLERMISLCETPIQRSACRNPRNLRAEQGVWPKYLPTCGARVSFELQLSNSLIASGSSPWGTQHSLLCAVSGDLEIDDIGKAIDDQSSKNWVRGFLADTFALVHTTVLPTSRLVLTFLRFCPATIGSSRVNALVLCENKNCARADEGRPLPTVDC